MTTDSTSQGIESTLSEDRVFQPPKAADVGAYDWHVGSFDEYKAMYDKSIADPEGFWGEVAKDMHWFTPWDSVLKWEAPDAQWFVGGKTNVCYNCVDRQVDDGHGDQTAIIWEGEPTTRNNLPKEVRRLSYNDLKEDTAKLANALKDLGVKKGDVVTIYMGMVPELAVAMLACARIGAPHSVIFGGFSAQAIADRVQDASSKVIITCDGAWRRGKVVDLKTNVDEAIDAMGAGCPVEKVLMLKRTKSKVNMVEGRDVDWHTAVDTASDDCPCEPMDSEDMLFLLYTSGSTGKPKGIVHTTGGYMVYTYMTSRYTFNLAPDQNQVFWCTADCGWITGHSYIVYGILPNRVPTLMYEGAPDYPTPSRFWRICERNDVTHFYTAPTAIRAFMKWGEQYPQMADLNRLQVLGTVGEPINPEAWMWYRKQIGRDVCPIVDTYWQTETGGHIITPLPGATPCKPGSCTHPMLGIDAAVVSQDGVEQAPNTGGLMVIRKPWPGMLRGVFGDRERFIDTYWSTVKIDGQPVYTAGDGARRDDMGNFWIMGRIDDVINVSGHRMGTMEVESALVSHPSVVEAAVVGMPHEIKGTGIAAFVTLAPDIDPAEGLKGELREHVAKEIGPIAKPDQIRFTTALPKTRSGKIMRRLLRSIAAGETEITQDVTTLEDFSVVAKLAEKDEG